jgi:hypothetical protein
MFHQFPASYPQAFAQPLPSSFLRNSVFFPQLLHMFFVIDFDVNCVFIFRSDFKRNPEHLAASAGEKNGEKKAGDRNVWKSGVRASDGPRAIATGGRKRPKCTRFVARGTLVRSGCQ